MKEDLTAFQKAKLLPNPKEIQNPKVDGLAKSLLKRHPGEPRIRSGAGAGVQNILK
jgi:hypothetical protein